jgi:hypothetical protein
MEHAPNPRDVRMLRTVTKLLCNFWGKRWLRADIFTAFPAVCNFFRDYTKRGSITTNFKDIRRLRGLWATAYRDAWRPKSLGSGLRALPFRGRCAVLFANQLCTPWERHWARDQKVEAQKSITTIGAASPDSPDSRRGGGRHPSPRERNVGQGPCYDGTPRSCVKFPTENFSERDIGTMG